MSKHNYQTKQSNTDEEEKFNIKRKPWNYPDQNTNFHLNQNRKCCSPVDEMEALEAENENVNATQSVKVQTDKSLFLLKQDKRIDNSSRKNHSQVVVNKDILDNKRFHFPDNGNVKSYQINEFENVKLKKTGFSYEHEKLTAKLADNINTSEGFDEYSETDVDQPMDYSTLCYDESNMDEGKKENASFLHKNEFVCIEEAVLEEKGVTVKSKGAFTKEPTRNKKEMFSNTSRSFKEIFNFFKDRDKKRSVVESTKASTFEGTKLPKTPETYEQKIEKSSQPVLPPVEQSDKEIKLKCEAQGSQQTPLMFSRCSSLGSLNGFEQNSVQDDRSSIVSDFSRRTSGVVSPSELPDSPAHTTSSNRGLQQKSQIGCFGKRKIQMQQYDKPKVCQQLSLPNENSLQSENILKRLPVAKRSVFEDNITSFKDESTPTKLYSMAASSLSSLTIDDEDDYDLSKIILDKEKQNPTEEVKIQNDRQEPIGESNINSSINIEKTESISQEQDQDFIEEEEEEEEENDELTDLTPYEEQLLDECIRRGIAKWTKRNINEIKPFSWDLGLTCRATRAMLTSRIRVNSYSDIHNEIIERQNHRTNQAIINNNLTFEQDEPEELDNRDKYSYKETSLTEPNSNKQKANNQFDGNSLYITYEEHLLDQCIRKGMAKITKRNINEIRPFSWDANQICLTTRAMLSLPLEITPTIHKHSLINLDDQTKNSGD